MIGSGKGRHTGSPAGHVIITLDAFETSAQALEDAVRLAASMGVQIEGLFVEDIDLIRSAELPFLREVRTFSRSEARMDLVRVEQELRVLARRAEGLLREQAERHHVAWSFRTWRGSIDEELLNAVADAGVAAMTRLGARMHDCVLRRDEPGGIAVLYTGSETSTRALAVAINLVSDTDIRINVLLQADDDATAEQLRRRIGRELGSRVSRVRFVRLDGASAESVLDAVRESSAAALIVGRDFPLLRTASLQQTLGRYSCPLLLVR